MSFVLVGDSTTNNGTTVNCESISLFCGRRRGEGSEESGEGGRDERQAELIDHVACVFLAPRDAAGGWSNGFCASLKKGTFCSNR